jgi:predicted dehydrogenase
MADAIAEQRPQRITGEQAAHVVEVLCAIKAAYEQGQPVEVTSAFAQPAPMDWAV